MTRLPPPDHDPAAPNEAAHAELRRAIHASHARRNADQAKPDPHIAEADLPMAPLADGEARRRARWAWLLKPAAAVESPFG